MQDLISRQAAIKAIHEEFDECLVWDESGQQTADEVESILTSLPSADAVEVRHGHWIDTNGRKRYPFWVRYECSECGAKASDYRFCPHCGARMGGEQNG